MLKIQAFRRHEQARLRSKRNKLITCRRQSYLRIALLCATAPCILDGTKSHVGVSIYLRIALLSVTPLAYSACTVFLIIVLMCTSSHSTSIRLPKTTSIRLPKTSSIRLPKTTFIRLPFNFQNLHFEPSFFFQVV